ncbi:MAG: LacI family DNA-binding transcriptional regulator [Candidatus Promineifilaceae bacterium]|nr:LacI family DNA-binding transcriptional regulator [Candidatus Promineifilaceae bacterium]
MFNYTGIDSGISRNNHHSIFKGAIPTMPITINDISEKLGVSISTVSRALNDRADVSQATRDRVLQVAQELGYQPSGIARSLRRQRTDKIGFVFNDTVTYFSDYFAEIIAGSTIAAEENGHNIVLYTNEGHSPDGLLQLCKSREVDGLILVWDHVPSIIIEPLLAEGLPFVILGRRVNHPLASYIAPDNYNGALALMQHFLDLGHTRIGFTTRRLSMKLTRVDRFAAYQDALENAGIPFDPTLVVETEGGLPDNHLAANQLLDLPNPPTAIFAFHDLVAVDFLNTIIERGLRVPQDVALAGFDGLNASLFTKPSITTVKQPLREIGSQSVQALLQCIDNPNQSPIQITLPVQLEIRESTVGKHL